MRRLGAERSLWGITLLMVVVLLSFLFLFSTAAGSSQCQAIVTIVGQVVDENARPVSGEEVKLSFYVSPYKRDVEMITVTGDDGWFLIEEAAIAQSAYLNFDTYYTEIQARLTFPDYEGAVLYESSPTGQASAPGYYENWAEDDSYPTGTIQLFHHVRVMENNGQQPEFADVSIQLGSIQNPGIFKLADGTAVNKTIKVSHLDARSGVPVAEEETFTYRISGPTGQVTPTLLPKAITGMAALRVEEEDHIMAEAQRGSPISSYLVMGAAEQQNREPLRVIFYYHPDRDNDGIPDHLVREQYMNADGQPLAGGESQPSLYAHRDRYRAVPKTFSGYEYIGYRQESAEANGTIQTGVPEKMVTEDMTYQLIYEKGSEGGGGVGNPSPQPPPKEEEEEGPSVSGPPPEEPEPPKEPLLPEEPETGEEAPPEEPPLDQEDLPVIQPSRQGEESNTLSREEREERRNVSFIKESHRQDAWPGEEVAYGFTGFENRFPYALTEFTIVDRPDPGLDLVSIQLPAFQKGAGGTCDVVYTTNQQQERLLGGQISTDSPATLYPPPLREGEHITSVAIRFGEVVSGFGTGDEIVIAFRIWDDPPADTLHNLGYLYYSDQGETVTVRSADTPSLVRVKEGKEPQENRLKDQHPWQSKGLQRQDQVFPGKQAVSWMVMIVIIGTAMGTGALIWKKKKQKELK